METDCITTLGLFSHKMLKLNTPPPSFGRGNLVQLIQWVQGWLLQYQSEHVVEGAYCVGVVPDALVAWQLNNALPGLNVITGDEAPGYRKQLFNRIARGTAPPVIMTLREALPWLKQYPHLAPLVWAWGQGVQQRLRNPDVATLLQSASVQGNANYTHHPRLLYWGKSVSGQTQRALNTENHRLLWVMKDLYRQEQRRIINEAHALTVEESTIKLLHQHTAQPQDVKHATAFIQSPQGRVLCCDATVFASLILPRTTPQGEPLQYHLVLESRRHSKELTLPEDVIHASPWCSITHYTLGKRGLLNGFKG